MKFQKIDSLWSKVGVFFNMATVLSLYFDYPFSLKSIVCRDLSVISLVIYLFLALSVNRNNQRNNPKNQPSPVLGSKVFQNVGPGTGFLNFNKWFQVWV